MITMFCGHSAVYQPETLKKPLYNTIENLISEGCTKFYLGGYGDFDNLAASAVRELKHVYPFIESILIIAYPDVKADAALYDSSLHPPLENVPKRFAISRRNRWMVGQADVLIAYVEHDWGGAAKILAYAQSKGLRIINLAERRDNGS